MNLHRSEKIPEWETVEPDERNIWQKIAARTGGVVTPGNAASTAGAVLTFKAIAEIARGDIKAGMAKAVPGRLLDLVDGGIAHATGTKGPIGEAIDAVVDKAELGVALPAFVKADIVPAGVAVMFGARDAANSVFTGMAKRRGREIHPSKNGKNATFSQWLAIGAFVTSALARESGRDRLADGLNSAGYLFSGAAIGLGTRSNMEYARDAGINL